MRTNVSIWAFTRPTVLLSLLWIAGCGTSSNPPGAGSQTLPSGTQPPPGGSVTDVSCSDADPCSYWYCECANGTIVNAANCDNGHCSTADAICPTACTALSDGMWTGNAGGGPGQQQPPPSSTCGFGSTNPACLSCVEAACCDESTTCNDDQNCVDLYNCAESCGGDTTCIDQCKNVATESAIDEFANFLSCIAAACDASCS